MGEVVFLSVLLIVCGLFFGLSFGFQTSVLDTSGGAGLWPRIIIIFMAVFLVIRIVQVLRDKNRAKFVFTELFKGPRLFFLVALAAYMILFKFLGYIVCTIAFLFVVVNMFYKWTNDSWGNMKSIIVRNVLCVVFVLALYFFFTDVVHILLPVGTIWP